MLSGIKDILIISNEETLPWYKKLFGNGSKYGLKIEYAIQDAPNGIAQSFIIGEEFIGKDSVTLILGDNIFYGNLDFMYNAIRNNKGATIFGYRVTDPERYGIVNFDSNGNITEIEEKPKVPKSNFAVPGLYVYDNKVVEISKSLRPSARGELEITDVNNSYLKAGELQVVKVSRGVAWLDTGTPEALLQASNFFGVIEDRQGLKAACLEEIAYGMNYISKVEFEALVNTLPKSLYREYLEKILKDK
jgi:glucose-1-phosphate thymidylyltransferase